MLTPGSTAKKLVIADPARSVVTLPKADFLRLWISTCEEEVGKGTVLLLEPTPQFSSTSNITEDEQHNAVRSLKR